MTQIVFDCPVCGEQARYDSDREAQTCECGAYNLIEPAIFVYDATEYDSAEAAKAAESDEEEQC